MPSVEKLKKDTGSIFHNYFASIKKNNYFCCVVSKVRNDVTYCKSNPKAYLPALKTALSEPQAFEP